MADGGYFGPNRAGATSKLSSLAKARAPAIVTRTLTLAVNGSTLGTVVYAAGKATPTFATTSQFLTLVNVGDVVTQTAPSTQDSGLSDLVGYIALQ